jgi:hypothetical protein
MLAFFLISIRRDAFSSDPTSIPKKKEKKIEKFVKVSLLIDTQQSVLASNL